MSSFPTPQNVRIALSRVKWRQRRINRKERAMSEDKRKRREDEIAELEKDRDNIKELRPTTREGDGREIDLYEQLAPNSERLIAFFKGLLKRERPTE
jgi:hypothetical protein